MLVMAVSFVLALTSMRDFTEIPSRTGGDFSVFLIRQIRGLNEQFFNLLYNDLKHTGLNISFERLFKGKESALVVFGPKKLLMSYKDFLNLLELEDYTSNVNIGQMTAWEVGIKNTSQLNTEGFKNALLLSDDEQFWWQLVLWVNKQSLFQAQIRAIAISSDAERRKSLTKTLQNLSNTGFIKLPKAFSDTQLIDFYKKRSFQKDNRQSLRSDELKLHLLRFLPIPPHYFDCPRR